MNSQIIFYLSLFKPLQNIGTNILSMLVRFELKYLMSETY